MILEESFRNIKIILIHYIRMQTKCPYSWDFHFCTMSSQLWNKNKIPILVRLCSNSITNNAYIGAFL